MNEARFSRRSSNTIDVTIPDGLREMLEEFVRSVVSTNVKSRELHKYACHYFRKHYDDTMDDETEERIRATLDDIDNDDNRRLTRPSLFGDTFNPETERTNLLNVRHEKTMEEENFLRESIPITVPFRALDQEQIERTIGYFEKFTVNTGQILMREKEEGDYFYLIQTGTYEALIDDKQVKIYDNQGSFGELALLYNQPRSATIRALTDGKLWRMNRSIFSKIVRSVAFEKRQRHLKFIRNCSILRNMNKKEMLDVADALKREEYNRNDTIIREGDAADAS